MVLLLSLLMPLMGGSPGMAESTIVQAKSTNAFRDTVGVNTHLSWIGTSYWNFDQVVDALDYLGIGKVRDIIAPWSVGNIDKLGDMGVEFSFIIGREDIPFQLNAIEDRAAITDYVEGPNEIDNWPITFQGQSGLAGAEALMTYLRGWIDASPTLGDSAADTPLAQVSFGHTDTRDVLIDIKDKADVGNSHSYAPFGWNPSRVLDDRIAGAEVIAPNRPVITTEAGYHTAVDSPDWTGVNETVQAKYTLTLLLEQFTRGIDKTYLYELFDQNSSSARNYHENHFGLLRTDGTPKPAGRALAAMMAIFGDSETGLTPEELTFELANLPSSADSLLLQRSSDTFVLAVWNDVTLWDDASDQPISIASRTVTLTLDAPAARVTVYDPILNERTPVSIGRNAQSVTFALSDHPVLIEIVESDVTAPVKPDPVEPDPVEPVRQGLVLPGGPDGDLLVGGDLDDTISGAGGVDTLYGGRGDDLFLAGPGDDYVNGGHDIDTISFEAVNVAVTLTLGMTNGWARSSATGRDSLLWIENATGGSAGDHLTGDDQANRLIGLGGVDTLRGSGGNDVLNGGAGGDFLQGDAGADTLLGGEGGDQLLGGDGDDSLDGGSGDDRLGGGSGNDRIIGGEGADRISGSNGSDILYGGVGSDTFVLRTGHGVDRLMDLGVGDLFEVTQVINGLNLSSGNALLQRLGSHADGSYLDLGRGNGVIIEDLDLRQAEMLLRDHIHLL